MPWGGMSTAIVQKFYAVRRAAQILRRLVPRAAVLVADALDTMVVNGVSSSTATMLTAVGASRRMFVSGECNSWPRCYSHEFRADDNSARCIADSSAACFANSGAYAASAAALQDALLPAAVQMLNGGASSVRLASIEVGHDQAAMTRAYLGRGAYAGLSGYAIDSRSRLFLNLYACRGRNFTRVGNKGHQYCHFHASDPLSRIRLDGHGGLLYLSPDLSEDEPRAPAASQTTLAQVSPLKLATVSAAAASTSPSARAARAGASQGTSAGSTRPLLLHSNGAGANGKKLSNEYFRPLRRRAWPPGPLARSQPVLLIDSAVGGACAVLSFERLINESRASCHAEPACRKKMG